MSDAGIPVFESVRAARQAGYTAVRYSLRRGGFTSEGLRYCPASGCDAGPFADPGGLPTHLSDDHAPEDFGLSPLRQANDTD